MKIHQLTWMSELKESQCINAEKCFEGSLKRYRSTQKALSAGAGGEAQASTVLKDQHLKEMNLHHGCLQAHLMEFATYETELEAAGLKYAITAMLAEYFEVFESMKHILIKSYPVEVAAPIIGLRDSNAMKLAEYGWMEFKAPQAVKCFTLKETIEAFAFQLRCPVGDAQVFGFHMLYMVYRALYVFYMILY